MRQVNFKIQENIYRVLKVVADSEGVSVSEIIRRAIENYLSENGGKKYVLLKEIFEDLPVDENFEIEKIYKIVLPTHIILQLIIRRRKQAKVSKIKVI